MASKKNKSSASKKSVFSIKPPEDEGSVFILLVSRGGSFLGGGAHCAFAVDYIVTETDPSGRAVSVKGWRRPTGDTNVLVTEFPVGVNYLLARRDTVRIMSMMEMAVEQKAEEEEVAAALGELGPEYGGNGMAAIEIDKPAGQYL